MFKNDGPDVALLFSYSAPEVNAEHYSQQAYLEMIDVVSCSGCQKSKVWSEIWNISNKSDLNKWRDHLSSTFPEASTSLETKWTKTRANSNHLHSSLWFPLVFTPQLKALGTKEWVWKSPNSQWASTSCGRTSIYSGQINSEVGFKLQRGIQVPAVISGLGRAACARCGWPTPAE